MHSQNSLYYIATTMLPGIGPVLARQLISYLGSVEQIFKESPKNLAKIPKIGETLAQYIKENNVMQQAEKEFLFIQKNNIHIAIYTDADYPHRLKNCDDAPLLLYYKGNNNFNHSKIISIVGTRSATEYGKRCCKELIADLQKHNPIVVSGLAMGIDICAHKEALKNGLETIAVLGTQLSTVTPASHIKYAREIIAHKGTVLSECHSQTIYDNALYVKRNRIIAGMSDITIIVESKTRGGALITAEYANQYNRDVAAFPGNIYNTYSQGCNMLIKQNKAHLIESAQDVERILNWDIDAHTSTKTIQKQLFVDLQGEELTVFSLLQQSKELTIDQIATQSNIPMSKTSSILLQLEFKGYIQAFPGKRFSLA
ncbi:MAG TPA: DNA-processing protein DprA [Bacteroidales bacterium]|nr:DNA-processing protein DprA [Bacteroidales bacterium]HRS19375.1 DNA-processing protein DprA [Bacteroidales bacterium]